MTVRSFVLLACAAGAVTAAAVLAPSALPARLDSSTQPIAYSDLNGDLFVNTVSAGGESPVFQNDGSASMGALSISPDGKQVLALSSGDDVQLVLVPAAGGTPVPIAGTVGAQDGSISPDGKLAVFSIAPGGSDTLDAGIYTVPVGGGTPKSIVATPDNATDSLPVLSPDQTQVAFVRDGVDSNGDEVVALEVQPVAGGTVRQLATDVSSNLYNGGRLSFSPDGKTIAYSGAFDNPGIFTASVASGTVAQLTSDTDYWPNFLPDGSAIAFSRDASSTNADDNQDDPVAPAESDTDELWTMQVDGTSSRPSSPRATSRRSRSRLRRRRSPRPAAAGRPAAAVGVRPVAAAEQPAAVVAGRPVAAAHPQVAAPPMRSPRLRSLSLSAPRTTR